MSPVRHLLGRKEIFYLMTTEHIFFLQLYVVRHMVKDNTAKKETLWWQHMGYSFQLAANNLLYAPLHRKDSTYNDRCYTSCGALASLIRNSLTFNVATVLRYTDI